MLFRSALFDAADPNGVTAVRNETTVAPQSLFLMNNPLVRDSALTLAQQLIALPAGEGGPTEDDLRIHEAHRRVLGRAATDEEVGEAREFLAAAQNVAAESAQRRLAAWQSYCQSLLCSNEFLYVE